MSCLSRHFNNTLLLPMSKLTSNKCRYFVGKDECCTSWEGGENELFSYYSFFSFCFGQRLWCILLLEMLKVVQAEMDEWGKQRWMINVIYFLTTYVVHTSSGTVWQGPRYKLFISISHCCMNVLLFSFSCWKI